VNEDWRRNAVEYVACFAVAALWWATMYALAIYFRWY
jgi:hypothetical protein